MTASGPAVEGLGRVTGENGDEFVGAGVSVSLDERLVDIDEVSGRTILLEITGETTLLSTAEPDLAGIDDALPLTAELDADVTIVLNPSCVAVAVELGAPAVTVFCEGGAGGFGGPGPGRPGVGAAGSGVLWMPPDRRPGVSGCVSSDTRSMSRHRIWIAGPTVAMAPGPVAVVIMPQIPPRKSVVSEVQAMPLIAMSAQHSDSYFASALVAELTSAHTTSPSRPAQQLESPPASASCPRSRSRAQR